jgi:predicted nucleic acid-binding protein
VLATFVTVDLELGYCARDPSEHEGISRSRGRLLQLAAVDEIAIRARQVQALMAAGSEHWAAGVIDLLTAAAAEHYGASVLHYDAHFDHIAAVTGQAADWITPKASAR